MSEIDEPYKIKIQKLETKISDLATELETLRSKFAEETGQRQFYQLVADFTYGWELWFNPEGNIKYCSPSCIDMTGFSQNQIILSGNLSDLLVFEADKRKFDEFLKDSLKQDNFIQSLEFRMMTRNKQLRWCSLNVRGVYNKQGQYLGVRASIYDITRLKNALGQILDLAKGKELDSRSKIRMKSELDIKERELVSFLLQLSGKNELLKRISNALLNLLNSKPADPYSKINAILASIGDKSQDINVWELTSVQIEKLHPGFLDRLKIRNPGLTIQERKLCTFLKLGLSSKDIAGLFGISPKSIEISRVRLRKKLQLERHVNLLRFLDDI